MLDVECLITGYLEENCYILNIDKKALIIDPGDESERILNVIKKNNYEVLGILITHHHFDHVGALKKVMDEYPVAKVIDHKSSGDIVIEPFHFKIIETPGHTSDSISFYFENFSVLFSGDFVFRGTIGNFKDEDEENMLKSLKLLKYFPKEVTVYPGHGEPTTIGEELESNPFLKGI